MARALKTFCYSDGFHAWTVASTSRAGALAAWGVKRDLFKDGSAREISEGQDREAALAAPGELIERGLAVDIGQVAKKATPKASTRSKADGRDRARVEVLESELARLDEEGAAQIQAFEVDRAAVERRALEQRADHEKRREAVKARLKTARARLT